MKCAKETPVFQNEEEGERSLSYVELEHQQKPCSGSAVMMMK